MSTIIKLFLGATLEIITDKSQEGAQFCKGFGGVGGNRVNSFSIFSKLDLFFERLLKEASAS